MKETLKKIPYLKKSVDKAREYRRWITNRIEYWDAILSGKPYFGTIHSSNMQNEDSIRELTAFIKQIARDDFTMIELGTWVGNSAGIWGTELKKFKNTKVLCIDSMYMPQEQHDLPINKVQSNAIKKNKMVPLLLRNIKALGLEDIVFLAKIPFEKMSSYLKKESIDFLYIDLGHNYEENADAFKRYLPLVKKGGWVGGDDYDEYHLYRVKAIKEYLGEVNVGKRFWYKQI